MMGSNGPRFPESISVVRAAVFDMDGVLVDSEAFHLRADRETLLAYGLDVPDEAWKEIFGMTSETGLSLLLERYGDGSLDPSMLAREKRERYLDLSASSVEPMPLVREFIEAARKYPGRLAVATSGRAVTQLPILDRLGLTEVFETIVTGDDVRIGKPHPEPYLLAAARLGLPPRECLVFEDAPAGVRSAKDAGCPVIGLSGTVSRESLLAEGADFVIAGFHELL